MNYLLHYFAGYDFMHTYAKRNSERLNKKGKRLQMRKRNKKQQAVKEQNSSHVLQDSSIGESLAVDPIDIKASTSGDHRHGCVLSSEEIIELKRLLSANVVNVSEFTTAVLNIASIRTQIDNVIVENTRIQAKLLRRRKHGYVSILLFALLFQCFIIH